MLIVIIVVVVSIVLSVVLLSLRRSMTVRRLPTYVCYNFLQTLAHHRVDLPHETKHLYDFDPSAVFDPGAVTPSSNVVFVKTDLLDEFVDFYMDRIRTQFVLITGNSDLSPSHHATRRILSSPRVVRWASTNVASRHDSKITRGMPIGLSEPDRSIGDQGVVARCVAFAKTIPQKKRRVFFPPCGPTHPVRARLASFDHPMVDRLDGKRSFEDYLKTMAEYRWVVCPRGNGIDVHRVWEALLLRCIPIYVADSRDNVPLAYREFPMIRVATVDDLAAVIDDLGNDDIDWDDVRDRLTLEWYLLNRP